MRGNGTPTTYNEAVYQLVHRSDLPPKQIADRLGLGLSTLYNAANPDMDEPQLSHKHIVPATNLTRNFAVLDYFEHACGRVAFEIPAASDNVSEVARELSTVVARFGDLLAKVGQALENDGRVDESELELLVGPACQELITQTARLWNAGKKEAGK